MTRTGTVNYHVHKPERQAFHIDAGGVVDNLISPELAATQVPVRDVRKGEARVSFQADSVAFRHFPTNVTAFKGDAWEATYDQELTELLTRELGAKEVVLFDHTVRIDDPNSDRRPARNVHSD